MTTNEGQRQCERCGEPVSAAAGGLCPRCLLDAAQAGLRAAASDGGRDETLAGYRLLDKIGEGGMGEVFLAEQTVPVRREVALKVLKPGLDTAEWLRRFELEREALAHFAHPNIAAIFDAGVGSGGRPFYVMELVDGLPLSHFCDRAKLDVPARLRLFATVCAAVQHAHQKGVLHGDLKPSNILVATDEDGAAVPKLIDFGLARAGWKSSGDTRHFGTPGYASPEQTGGARPADVRSDVYSLGVVLRELLAGDAVLRGEAGWIVRRATAPVPEERYESAADLAGDVRNLLACRPLAAGPDTWSYRASKFLVRERRRLAFTVVVCSALIGTTVMLSRQAWRAHRAEAGARMARQRADMDLLRARLIEELVHGLAGGGRAESPDQRKERIRGLLRRVEDQASEVEARGAPGREVAFSVRMALATAANSAGVFDEAEQNLLAARELARLLGPPGEGPIRGVEGALARTYLEARRYQEAETVLLQLISESSSSRLREDMWEPLFDLTRLYMETRRFAEAEAPARRALELARQHFEPEDPTLLRALHQLGRVQVERRLYREAYDALKEAATGYQRRFGPDAPETRRVSTDLAEVETVLRNREELPAK